MNRHFKKYYFYLLARCLCLFGFYDRSLPYYSRVIQFRTFFFDVQYQYMHAYEKSSKLCNLEIHGGIGDFLQHLPFMMQYPNENYVVITHFPKAKEFFKALNIGVNKIFYYENGEQHRAIKNKLRKHIHSYVCPRKLFFRSDPFEKSTISLLKRGPVVGFHMSTSNQTSGNLDKKFVLKLIKILLDKKMTIVLFGTHSELKTLHLDSHPHLIFASHKNIISNLAIVKHCDLLIGAESAFKTMSSMSGIPTLVYHADNNNHFRDRVFINPYIKAGVMTVYKYQVLEKEIDPAIHFALSAISKLKLNILGFKN
jgi:ADP-heptose:LPS heptosyltransferase